jgi:hypothetical protein
VEYPQDRKCLERPGSVLQARELEVARLTCENDGVSCSGINSYVALVNRCAAVAYGCQRHRGYDVTGVGVLREFLEFNVGKDKVGKIAVEVAVVIFGAECRV